MQTVPDYWGTPVSPAWDRGPFISTMRMLGPLGHPSVVVGLGLGLLLVLARGR